MRPHRSLGAVLALLLMAALCPDVAVAGNIVFPEMDHLPGFVNSAAPSVNTVPTGGSKTKKPVEVISPCVWAIVSCCQPGDTNVRGRCFELLGCGGEFWDLSPCSPEVTWTAAKAADRYFKTAVNISP